MSTPVIGIDLGTTYSAVSLVEGDRPVILRNSDGANTTPSVIYFPGGGASPLVGLGAKMMLEAGETEVAAFFKRQMGARGFLVEYHGQTYNATQLSTIVLRHLLVDTVQVSGADAMITVPAYFDNERRNQTIQAGRDAGLNVLGTVNEPTAAAIAFGLTGTSQPKIALIFDLGGGTFDVAIVRIQGFEVEVLGSDGAHELGGKDWDDRLVRHVAELFERKFNTNPLDDILAGLDLSTRCEGLKRTLSTASHGRVTITHAGERGTFDVTRAEFEEITRDLMEQTLMLSNRALGDLEPPLNWDSLDEVVLVGGSTRMPMVMETIRKVYSGPFAQGVNPDEAVALGAAIQARRRLGTVSKQFFLGGELVVKDVTAHSLGMIAEDNDRSRYINSILIGKNQPIPSEQMRPFQQRIRSKQTGETEVYVLQGESHDPRDCTIIGKYVISQIQPERSGTAVIEVSYSYDKNGVVNVSAKQRSTKIALPVKVEPVPEDMNWLQRSPKENDVRGVEHISVYLAIDLSGSMDGDPLVHAQKAAHDFVRQLDLSCTSVGLTIFADQVRTTVDLTQSERELARGINRWSQFMEGGDVGYGNSAHPFDELHSKLRKGSGRKYIIVLTDGLWGCTQAALSSAAKAKGEDIEIIAMGFGSADGRFLQELANSSENAILTDLSHLSQSFSRIAQVLSDVQSGGAISGATGKRGIFR